MTSLAIVLMTLALLPTAVGAQTFDAAQTRRPMPVRATPKQSRGARAFATFDVNMLAATETFRAITGTSTFTAIGAGGEFLNAWKGLFIRAAVSSMKKDGERVIVFDGEAVSLGIPMTIEMLPVEFGAGWRATLDRRGRHAVYVGGGFVHLIYRETSPLAVSGENTDTTFDGGMIFGGVDLHLWGPMFVGAEVQYRTFPNAIGSAGASAAFGETDLGGGTLRGMWGVRF